MEAGARIQQRVRATPASVPRLRGVAEAFATEHCQYDDELFGAIALCVTEACTNVIRHAYPDRAGDITLTMWLLGPEIVIRVEDQGVGMKQPASDAGLGLGVAIMQRLATVNITARDARGDGTVVELRFPRQG